MRIVFLVPYPPGRAPSQRFRFEQYFPELAARGIEYRVYSFLSEAGWNVIYSDGRLALKTLHLLSGFLKRIGHLLLAMKGDFVFVHRETSPVGPPVFEWLLAKLFKKKLIYDFDDAIWMEDINNKANFLNFLRWRRKVSSIIRWSYKVSCGNQYLRDFARQFNSRVFLNPTTIDTLSLHNPNLFNRHRSHERVTIGWTGTHSTLSYLSQIDGVLNRICSENRNVCVLVIANRPPVGMMTSSVEFRKWTEANEIPDLLDFDIGIMPLTDDDWSKGKCGFKALQYMALEIPAVVSPVGVNTSIITDGVNGFLATDDESWYRTLSMLIRDPSLRNRIGKEARKTVEENYSVLSNTSNFLSLFA